MQYWWAQFCLPDRNLLAHRHVLPTQKIYRCYVVWQSIWIIIVPMMCWCCGAGQVTIMLRKSYVLMPPRSDWYFGTLQRFASD